ncbi:MAG: MBL fold metallo-hydrolase [Firmicutes bacterium]|nr:MBL fold metallo-hydrolase [Bacillota bacterium]
MYEKVADNIYFIEGENRGRDPYSNSLLIDDQVKVLIDTGIGPDRIKRVSEDFDIDLIFLSHGHEDHIAGNPSFPATSIGVHVNDVMAVKEVSHQLKLFGVTGTDLEEVTNWVLRDMFQLKDSRVDFEFDHGDCFSFGAYEMNVIHTPGHCAGHCCFLIPSARLLFLADISLSSFGPLYNKVDSNLEQFISSIELLKTTDFEVAISSHKGIFSDRNKVLINLELFREKIFQRDEALFRFLQRERTLDEIADEAIVYGVIPEPRAMYTFLEKTMISKHLKRLMAKGLVKETDRGYIIF